MPESITLTSVRLESMLRKYLHKADLYALLSDQYNLSDYMGRAAVITDLLTELDASTYNNYWIRELCDSVWKDVNELTRNCTRQDIVSLIDKCH